MEVVEYWHGTIKNYRYDGDVSQGSQSRDSESDRFSSDRIES